jgi:type I restriction enzyme S subunit
MNGDVWPKVPLGDLFDIGAGKAMSAAARADGSKVPFLRTSNVFWDRLDLSTVDEMVTDSSELRTKDLQPGDLLVCEGGEIGRAAIWDGRISPVTFQNHLHRLRPKQLLASEIEPRFYVFFLQSGFTQQGIFEGAGNKTTIPNLSRNRLAGLDVPIPPKGEQQEIVGVLGAVRSALDIQAAMLEATETLKRAVMQDLFTRGLRGGEPQESEIGPIPEGWVSEELSAHHTVSSGGTPSRGAPEYWTDGTIPWVKTAEVDYRTITDTSERITQAGLDSSAAKMLPSGTVLVAMYGQGVTRGKVGILGIPATTNQACAAIQPRNGGVLPRYLYHYLSGKYEELRSLAHGGQQQNLNLDIIRAFRIAYPAGGAEQQEIVGIFDALDAKVDLHRQKRAVFEELFQVLLHGLMTQEISVDDLDLTVLPECKALPA